MVVVIFWVVVELGFRVEPKGIDKDETVDEIEGADEDKEDDENETVEEVERSTRIFHPTIAIAPTVELWVSVVVAVLHVSDCPGVVDAKVNIMPEDTSDRQSPATEPSTPFSR